MNILKKHIRLLILLLLSSLNMGCVYLDRYPMGRQFGELRSSTLYDYLDEEDSLGGKDSNNNGIRDDIERWINEQNCSKEQKEALFLQAKALRNLLLVDFNDTPNFIVARKNHLIAVDCTMDHFFIPGKNIVEMDVLEAANANTDKRFERYMEADRRPESLEELLAEPEERAKTDPCGYLNDQLGPVP